MAVLCRPCATSVAGVTLSVHGVLVVGTSVTTSVAPPSEVTEAELAPPPAAVHVQREQLPRRGSSSWESTSAAGCTSQAA
eukprot:CAMPEP_0183375780 /NCGR_PEP_ID=MMETSP0164_2-20130417/118440_1 /TAXON_ID=221442 /ORGANISM="Coccolithus pelagicus ssp braarudi, Strain PLY182g" /LENGTH=79 /DNA_ID=CAMNT_0025552991 /DNA_START=390 /DNA_END=626 /DNA_ORIENTATION=-